MKEIPLFLPAYHRKSEKGLVIAVKGNLVPRSLVDEADKRSGYEVK